MARRSKDESAVSFQLEEQVGDAELECEGGGESIDLPSLASFKGSTYNFENIGPVVLESSGVTGE